MPFRVKNPAKTSYFCGLKASDQTLTMSQKHIFVLGTDDFNLIKLKSLRKAEHYEFHKLLDYQEIRGSTNYPVEDLLAKARRELKAFDKSIDGLIGFYDFPVTDMIPILAREFGLNAPSLQSVIKCEHKYWSRMEQYKVIPENIPDFCIFDPFREDARQQIPLAYPFWIKPVKSFRSYLGFKVSNEDDFREAIEITREHIEDIAKPFDYLLDYLNMPEQVEAISGGYCIAESIISGKQCTLEGYAYGQAVETYGIVDSYRDPNRSTFSRYEYPSNLPQRVQQRMADTAERVMQQVGFTNACFNVEFFYDEAHDQLWLLEVNPRMSQSHGDLFQKVDGDSNHSIMIDVALGSKPDFPHREGMFNHAAKFMYRKFEDAIVRRVPTAEEIQVIQQKVPGTFVEILVKEGIQLSELINQDSYSYEIADIFIGGHTQKELLENYDTVIHLLPFEFEEVTQVQKENQG